LKRCIELGGDYVDWDLSIILVLPETCQIFQW
jgi:hypothetical protein